MSKYGYVGKESDIPQQAFKANAGVLSVNDHLALSQENKLTQFGQLELIETQTYSSAVSSVEFTDIKENIYNVHFVTLNNIQFVSGSNIDTRFSINNGTSYVATGYQLGTQFGNASGSFTESISTNNNALSVYGANTPNPQNAYVYFYNLGDSTKYSFQTLHSTIDDDSTYGMRFGAGVYPQANIVNAIEFRSSTGINFSSFDMSLYGIRYS